MANLRDADGVRRARRRRKSYSELDDEKRASLRGEEPLTPEPDVDELRRIRLERLEESPTVERRAAPATPKMTSESYATLPTPKSAPSHRRRREHRRTPEEKELRRRRKLEAKDDSASTFVYGPPGDKAKSATRITISETRTLGRDGEASVEEEEEKNTEAKEIAPVKELKKRRIKIVYITEEEDKAARRKARRDKAAKEASDLSQNPPESLRRSRLHQTQRKSAVEAPISPPKRSSSTRDLPAASRPPLKRSNTTASHVPSSATATANKRSSFLGNFFGPAPPQYQEPEKLVECLTCLSDDIPRSKTAKLKCGHRMCHPCLRRIFKLSVTDPQHMPPKCCTADFIPLKHVDKLFDINFKKNWNRKFQEYSTKNRIYCPARRCGEWIKPGNIHKEDGRKYGKCGRCKTKVCCLCNGKWHGMKDCPKDEETNRLLETAKQAGWQRCYSCRTMVELKEGCNHMTCHCTAEFCMICGLKWKSCNCPWFNYDAIEADRLNHMQVPMPAGNPEDPPGARPNRLRRPRPNNYHEELNERRLQEREDEELARRLQRVAVDEPDDDYQGGIGDIHGIGNGAGHFMNQDYVRAAHNILTGTFDHATAAATYVIDVAQARGAPSPTDTGPRRMSGRYPAPPWPGSPPVLRRHSGRAMEAGSGPNDRLSERVVPRRARDDYQSEAEVHAPPERVEPREGPRPAVLAGLAAGRGSNRVDAWRTHVEPGATPAEGVLST